MTLSQDRATARLPAAPLSAQLADALAKHQEGRVDEAESAYLDILEAEPHNRHALFYLGTLHLEEERFTDAVNAFERLRDQDPSDIAVLWQLADVYKRLGNGTDTKLTHKELLIHVPETIESCILFAERFLRLNEGNYALTYIQKAIALAPTSNDVHYRLRVLCRNARAALLKQGRISEAIAILRQEVELHPEDLSLHRILCQSLGDAGQMDEALGYLKALATHAAASATLELARPLDLLDEIDFDDRRALWSTLPRHADVDLLVFAMRLPSYSIATALCNRLRNRFHDSAALDYLAAVIARRRSRIALEQCADLLQPLEKSYRDDPQFCFEMELVHRDQGNIASALIWLNSCEHADRDVETRDPAPARKGTLDRGRFR